MVCVLSTTRQCPFVVHVAWLGPIRGKPLPNCEAFFFLGSFLFFEGSNNTETCILTKYAFCACAGCGPVRPGTRLLEHAPTVRTPCTYATTPGLCESSCRVWSCRVGSCNRVHTYGLFARAMLIILPCVWSRARVHTMADLLFGRHHTGVWPRCGAPRHGRSQPVGSVSSPRLTLWCCICTSTHAE